MIRRRHFRTFKFLILRKRNEITKMPSEGPIHTGHFRAQYCDKKDIFGPWMSIGRGMLLSKDNARYTRFL
jgi:hypothetical protein